MADDEYGIFAPPSGVGYGIFDKPKKRPRSKRPRTDARDPDVEQPSAANDDDSDESEAGNYGLPSPARADVPDLTRGSPPGPAGKREGERVLRSEAPAWYEPLLESGISIVAGATSNLLDEATAGALAATDYAGLTKTGNSYDENRAMYKGQVDRATEAYPYAHGAGQMATGMAVGAALPAAGLSGVALQGLAQGALSGTSEYADTRELGPALGAAALGTAAGAGGAKLGNWAASRFAHVDPMKNLIRRGNLSPEDMAGAPAQNILARGGKPIEYVSGAAERLGLGGDDVVRGGLSPDDMAGAPTQDILARGGRPLEHVQTLEQASPLDDVVRGPVSRAEGEALGFRDPAPQGRPARMPLERREGLVTGNSAYESVDDALPAPSPRSVPPMEPPPPAPMSMEPPPPAPMSAAEAPPANASLEELLELSLQQPRKAAAAPPPRGPKARPSPAVQKLLGDLDRSPTPKLASAPTEPAYALGSDPAIGPLDVPPPQPRAYGPELPLREEIIPGGRVPSGPAEPIPLPPSDPPATRLGPLEARRPTARGPAEALELDVPAAPTSSMRPGPLEARRATARGPVEHLELDTPPVWDRATRAQRDAAKPTGGVLDSALGVASHVPGLGLPSRVGRAGLRMLGGGKTPPAADAVYPNEGARQLTRGLSEAAWELGLPSALGSSKANAQDVDHVAYAGASLAPGRQKPSERGERRFVAEPDVLAQLAGGATAFGQGAGFNVIDDLYDAMGEGESADYVREQVARYPNAATAGGVVRTGLAAALAPPAGAAQALAVGMTGAAGEYGRSGDGYKAALVGGLDGAVAGGSALAGQGVAAATNFMQKQREPISRAMTDYLKQYDDPIMRGIDSAARAGFGGARPAAAASALGSAERMAGHALYKAERFGGAAPRFEPLVPGGKPPFVAEAPPLFPEDHVAYADAPTFNYAVSEVLHAGSTGLSQADEEALTSAVVNGDDQKIAATSFRLRQRYPAYAQRVEKALRGLNEEEKY